MIKCKGADLPQCEQCARYCLQIDKRDKSLIVENPPEDTSNCRVEIHMQQVLKSQLQQARPFCGVCDSPAKMVDDGDVEILQCIRCGETGMIEFKRDDDDAERTDPMLDAGLDKYTLDQYKQQKGQ